MSTHWDAEVVNRVDWHSRARQAHDDGFRFCDFLTAVERENEFGAVEREVVLRVTRLNFGEATTLATRVLETDPTLQTVVDIYPGADWHEREVSEMFGVVFSGAQHAPLLRHEMIGESPLRKKMVLASRVITEWPGAAEPEIKEDGRKVGNPSRRRQRPPGVPEKWLQT